MISPEGLLHLKEYISFHQNPFPLFQYTSMAQTLPTLIRLYHLPPPCPHIKSLRLVCILSNAMALNIISEYI